MIQLNLYMLQIRSTWREFSFGIWNVFHDNILFRQNFPGSFLDTGWLTYPRFPSFFRYNKFNLSNLIFTPPITKVISTIYSKILKWSLIKVYLIVKVMNHILLFAFFNYCQAEWNSKFSRSLNNIFYIFRSNFYGNFQRVSILTQPDKILGRTFF